ncbi:hypothetical protein ES705_43171 [subsurface metagenome]
MGIIPKPGCVKFKKPDQDVNIDQRRVLAVMKNKININNWWNRLIWTKIHRDSFGECDPRVIRIYSRGELLQQKMLQKFSNDGRLCFFNRNYGALNSIEDAIPPSSVLWEKVRLMTLWRQIGKKAPFSSEGCPDTKL